MTVYEGFPYGVSDAFCQHAVKATSQYDSTCRALAAEILSLRAEQTRAVLLEHAYSESEIRRAWEEGFRLRYVNFVEEKKERYFDALLIGLKRLRDKGSR